ncbi:MAG: RNA polymerase factor sigma-54 [Candidatus Hydrogenedentota bacterium]
MGQRLVQTQSQRLMLTQKMQQALQILRYNAQELEIHVQQELETNPVLERVAPTEVEMSEESSTSNTVETHDEAPAHDVEFDLDSYVNAYDQRLREGRDLSINHEMAARRDHYQNSITKEESLVSKLMTQAGLTFQDETRYLIAELIIGEIDDRGYFSGDLDEISSEMNVPVSDVERVLYRIQKFEPVGVGARDIEECLLLQIRVDFPDEPELCVLVEEHFEALQKRQIPQIAKAMKVPSERIEKLKDMLSTLDPWPGNAFVSSPTQYIAADLLVEKEDGEYVVLLTSEGSPKLLINDEYRSLAKDKSMDKEERKYLREKVESANWLIRNVEQRQQTILKIGTAIVDVQREFLDKGVDKIKPLTLQEIADVVGVHEATVSRTTRGKYIQTPQGLFELKYFFSTGLKTTSGEDQSSKSVQLKIKKIIEAEDKRKPLSDQKVADMLKADGLSIARRTVSKYRDILNIPSTTMRREY